MRLLEGYLIGGPLNGVIHSRLRDRLLQSLEDSRTVLRNRRCGRGRRRRTSSHSFAVHGLVPSATVGLRSDIPGPFGGGDLESIPEPIGGDISIMSGSGSSRYRGVRMRRWGKWVSEIREPQRRDSRSNRIWLGSYRSAEEAAHAYDAALLCLRGSTSNMNFPNHSYRLPPGTPGQYSTREIQAAAACAAAQAGGRAFSYSNFEMSDDSDDEELEDITYTGGGRGGGSSSHTNIQQAAPPANPTYNESWRNFDDDNPYNQVNEMARGMMMPPPAHDDSDDSDDDDDEPRLW